MRVSVFSSAVLLSGLLSVAPTVAGGQAPPGAPGQVTPRPAHRAVKRVPRVIGASDSLADRAVRADALAEARHAALVYRGPHTTFDVVDSVAPHALVPIVGCDDGWCLVGISGVPSVVTRYVREADFLGMRPAPAIPPSPPSSTTPKAPPVVVAPPVAVPSMATPSVPLKAPTSFVVPPPLRMPASLTTTLTHARAAALTDAGSSAAATTSRPRSSSPKRIGQRQSVRRPPLASPDASAAQATPQQSPPPAVATPAPVKTPAKAIVPVQPDGAPSRRTTTAPGAVPIPAPSPAPRPVASPGPAKP